MNLSYGNKIKELREKENVSQRKLAEYMGIQRSSYNQFEQQYDIIPIKRLNQVANYFNVSIDYLFDLTIHPQYNNSHQDIDMEKSSQRLKEFRKKNKLTQNKLSLKLNASPSVLAHHENKRTPLATPYLYTICKIYNVSADYLLGKIDEPQDLT